MEQLIKIAVKLLFSIVALYLFYAGYYFLMQRRIIYPRNLVKVSALPFSEMEGLELNRLRIEGGFVESFYFKPKSIEAEQKVPAMIIAHGNAELIDYWIEAIDRLRSIGFAVLLVEYPGYGRSQGEPTEKSISESFMKAYDLLAAKPEIDTERIVLFGRSLGSGAVCNLAGSRNAAAIILLSPFMSVSSLANDYFLPGFLAYDKFDNQKFISTYDGPLLLLHGKYDRVIPYKHGEQLFQISRKGEMITYNCGHNDCISDWNSFWKDVEPFLIKNDIIPQIEN